MFWTKLVTLLLNKVCNCSALCMSQEKNLVRRGLPDGIAETGVNAKVVVNTAAILDSHACISRSS